MQDESIKIITYQMKYEFIFEMAALLFLCNGILLIQGNLLRVLSVLVLKIVSCLIHYIDLFLILNEEWSSLLFKDFPKVVFLAKFMSCAVN